MLDKILIANRGEIVVRIIRACREMNIMSVAVYSDADRDAQHVWLADEAAHIGPAPAGESYLRMDKLLDAARRHGCDSVHPGYGFLAENADFAAAVRDAGLTFIGPSPETIRAMGSKTAARRLMERAGVPVVPGYGGSESGDALRGAAESLGFPLLVKAVSGGGGKGMRTVQRMADFAPAVAAARREAQSAFGDDRIYLERHIAQPRHVEFQIFGDSHGNIVHLFERECSIQRRHQKIIEETPSPLLNEELRLRMGEAAVAAARAAGYENAGTVEFLVDADGNFYFLEMNTRLQVEHPITEAVTGVDLVELQLRVAAGEALPFAQNELTQRGHAIECRVYAEDPANGFVPAVGHVETFIEPGGPGVRVDGGVVSGDEVTVHYDPMLAKIIAFGANRSAAIARLERALAETVILGDVITNVPFLRAVLQHPVFVAGQATTALIDEHFADWQPEEGPPPIDALLAVAAADFLARDAGPQLADGETCAADSPSDRYSPWRTATGFRTGEA